MFLYGFMLEDIVGRTLKQRSLTAKIMGPFRRLFITKTVLLMLTGDEKTGANSNFEGI